MRILVCIKQLDSGEINRFDAHALEQALLLADEKPQLAVDVVTLGPESAQKIARRAFGMGVDNAIHIVAQDYKYPSSYVTASCIAHAVETISYDLVLTGLMSEDMMSGQTGPMLAEILGFPCVTGVVSVHFFSEKKIEIERELENGARETLSVQIPAVLTIQAGINTPRYPSLSMMLKADRKDILSFEIDELQVNCNAGHLTCAGFEAPEKTRAGRILAGSLQEKAEQVYLFLRQKNLI